MIYGSRDPFTFRSTFATGQSGPYGILEKIHHPNDPYNPVLAAFREAAAAGDPYADAQSWLNNLSAMDAGSEAWENEREHVIHAERVLSRLAGWTA